MRHYTQGMTNRPKRPRDPNQLARQVAEIATRQIKESRSTKATERARAAGTKGGPARSKALTAERRSEIARLGATARWKKSGQAALSS